MKIRYYAVVSTGNLNDLLEAELVKLSKKQAGLLLVRTANVCKVDTRFSLVGKRNKKVLSIIIKKARGIYSRKDL